MGIALGNATYKILVNIILEKIKPYLEKNYRVLSMDTEMEDL